MPDIESYDGMTVNERLVAAGLRATFDDAVSRRDRAEMIKLLESVQVEGAEWTVDTLLADPSRYGYRS